MINIFKILMLGFAGLMLSGCMSGGISKEARESVGWTNAPKWVVNGNDGGYSAVGDAPIVDKNVQFARTEATAAARGELIKNIEAGVSTSLSKEGIRVDAQINEKIKSVVNEFAQHNLQGVGVEKTWIDDAGTRIYVLVKLDKESEKNLKNHLSKQFKELNSSNLMSE
ncbi:MULTISPECIES: LPP20 family lipoprotein [unclassified Helicobacter]|uniref:LPP20 family lipoprotein n=1 Tax=unclassified Helicobacter TaxID=2593540 RepID=UPI000CF095F0|nr:MULTISPECIES: hypothetical protein [unclassified Helicobacter]